MDKYLITYLTKTTDGENTTYKIKYLKAPITIKTCYITKSYDNNSDYVVIDDKDESQYDAIVQLYMASYTYPDLVAGEEGND